MCKFLQDYVPCDNTMSESLLKCLICQVNIDLNIFAGEKDHDPDFFPRVRAEGWNYSFVSALCTEVNYEGDQHSLDGEKK